MNHLAQQAVHYKMRTRHHIESYVLVSILGPFVEQILVGVGPAGAGGSGGQEVSLWVTPDITIERLRGYIVLTPNHDWPLSSLAPAAQFKANLASSRPVGDVQMPTATERALILESLEAHSRYCQFAVKDMLTSKALCMQCAA